MRKTLRTARIVYSPLLVASLFYIYILVLIRPMDIYIFSPDDPFLTLISVVLGLVGVVNLASGIYFPRWLVRKQPKGAASAFTASILRWALFESIAIYGFVLGVIGARWEIILPFFIISIGALILSAPTEERWKRMIE